MKKIFLQKLSTFLYRLSEIETRAFQVRVDGYIYFVLHGVSSFAPNLLLEQDINTDGGSWFAGCVLNSKVDQIRTRL